MKGFIIGLSIAAPVGPISVLCIRRTLVDGRAFGWASGLGAATADAAYGCIAGFGLTFVSNALVTQQLWVRVVGGGFLCYVGLRTFLANPSVQAAQARGSGLAAAYASTALLTLTNPMTILAFAAIFAGLGLGSVSRDYVSAGLLVLGVFTGSTLWWLILSGAVGVLRTRLQPARLWWLNRLSGVVLLGFGVAALLSLRG